MVQEQLVQYISSQTKLGIARDAIRASLVGAGWAATDVDDSLKKVESDGGAPIKATAPASPFNTSPQTNASSGAGRDPQMLRVSDLISASETGAPVSIVSNMPSVAKEPAKVATPSSPIGKNSMTGPAVSPLMSTIPGMKSAGVSSAAPVSAVSAPAGATEFHASDTMTAAPTKNKKPLMIEAGEGVLILVFAAAAVFFYMQNSSLMTKVASLTTQSASVTSQLNSLKGALNASTTDLSASLSQLNAANTDLTTELSFYVAPVRPVGAPPIAATQVSISGTLSGSGKTAYLLTGKFGARITVANSKDPKVIASLNAFIPGSLPVIPVANSSSTTASSTASSTAITAPLAPSAPVVVMLGGTYIPGTPSITVTSVNGTNL